MWEIKEQMFYTLNIYLSIKLLRQGHPFVWFSACYYVFEFSAKNYDWRDTYNIFIETRKF